MSEEAQNLPVEGKWSLERFVQLATLVGVIFGAWSLWQSAGEAASQSRQFEEDQKLQREFTSYQTWEKKFEFSMQYPDLSAAKEGVAIISGEPTEPYMWFVERILISAEQILRAEPSDVQWRHSIMWEVRSHSGYILSDDFLLEEEGLLSSYCTYETGLRAVIRQSFSNVEASERLKKAEDSCLANLARLGSPNA